MSAKQEVKTESEEVKVEVEKVEAKVEQKETKGEANPLLPDFEDEEEEGGNRGPILEDGSINWDCPCLMGMTKGPCAEEFKASFSCFHYSTTEPKGSDCIDSFRNMSDCFEKYPEIYGPMEEDLDDGENPDPIPDETDPKEVDSSSIKAESEDSVKTSDASAS